MPLLVLRAELESRLEAVLTRLPAELCAQISSDLSHVSPADVDAANERTIHHDRLVKLAKHARRTKWPDASKYTLSSMLALTDVHAPPLRPKPRSPELERIMDNIRRDQEQREYEAMIASTNKREGLLSNPLFAPVQHAGSGKARMDEREEWEQVRKQVTAIANVVASMMAVATAVWWVGGGRSHAARVGLAASGAVAIAAIEGFLYYRFFTRPRGRIASGKTNTKAKDKVKKQ